MYVTSSTSKGINSLSSVKRSRNNHLSLMLNINSLKHEQLHHNLVHNSQRGKDVFSMMDHILS